MPGFALRLLVVAAGLWPASVRVPGIEVRGVGTLLGAALLLGLICALLRPLVILLTLPDTILTPGLLLLLINAGMLALVAWLLGNFHIAGFWPCLARSWWASPAASPRSSSARAGTSK